MTTNTPILSGPLDESQGFRGASPSRRALKLARRFPLVVAGSSLLVAIALVALAGPAVTRYDPEASDASAVLLSPNRAHPFGTDELGRDLLTRVVHGLRYSLVIAAASAVAVTCVGSTLGFLSGYFSSSWLDLAVMRVVDATLAIPLLVLAMVVVGGLGKSTPTVVLAISVGLAPSVVRVLRSAVIAESSRDYVQAAHVIGAGTPRILVRHIFPNVVSIILVLVSAVFGFAILVESSLSFLGLGPPPQVATLGRLLAVGGQRFWSTAPWMAIFPGLVLAFVILVVNVLGDALRDALDPRARL